MAETGAAARTRAEESIATRFTRVMNATTSRYGVLTDPPIVALSTSPLLIALLAARGLSADPLVVDILGGLVALPLLVALATSLSLLGARARVISWLAGLPFPVENMNAVLNGLGEGLEITFAGAAPSSQELNAELDKVSPDAFVTRAPGPTDAPAAPDGTVAKGEGGEEGGEGASLEPLVIEVRIGVVDSPRNPASTNHQRFERVRALVSSALVPLHERFPVASVRIK
jgi:hypothetical protein